MSNFANRLCLFLNFDFGSIFFARFVNPKTDKFFRYLVDTNKMSRTDGVQSADILQMLIQVQEKHGKMELNV